MKVRAVPWGEVWGRSCGPHARICVIRLADCLFRCLARLALDDAIHPLDASLGFPQGAELLPLAWGEAQTAYYWFFHGHARIVILWMHYLLAFKLLTRIRIRAAQKTLAPYYARRYITPMPQTKRRDGKD